MNLFGIALYDKSNGRAKVNKDMKCGTLPDGKGILGAINIAATLSAESCGSMKPPQTFLQTNTGNFHHAAVVAITEKGGSNSLKLGTASTITTGFAAYESKEDNAKQLDYW